MLITISFFILLLLYMSFPQKRKTLLSKPKNDWILDITGLTIQGTIIPIVQTFLLAHLLTKLFPHTAGTLDIWGPFAFVLNFVVVDYIYYWNHRLLHSKILWPFHRVHHSVEQFDIIATSRNSVWSSFLIVYVWLNGIAIFMLKDPTYYILALSITAALDLWKHTHIETSSKRLEHFLSKYLFIITPREHATHHNKKARYNFGANLNIFDKIHKTYSQASDEVWSHLGIKTNLSLTRSLFYPFNPKKRESNGH